MATLNGDYPGLSSGDPEATGRVEMTLFGDARKVCYRVRFSEMTVRAVYVYRRSDNALMTRLYDQAPTTGPEVSGCTTEVPRAHIRAYRNFPGRFYVKASSYDGSEEIAGVLRRP